MTSQCAVTVLNYDVCHMGKPIRYFENIMPPSTSLYNTTGNSDTPKYLVKLTKLQ